MKKTLTSCHKKTLVPFRLRKKIPDDAFLTLTVNHHKIVQKNKLCHPKPQSIGYFVIYDLFIHCLFWMKNWRFSKTIVRIYYILNPTFRYSSYINREFCSTGITVLYVQTRIFKLSFVTNYAHCMLLLIR